MKKTATVLSICLLGASVAQAALIVSPADGLDPAINNGGFELDGSSSQVTAGAKGDNDLLSWTATPSSGPLNGSSSIAKTTWNTKNTSLVSGGISSAVIGGAGQGLFLDTGYAVAEGDVFTLSLDWFPASQWTATDELEIYLYTTTGTDNTVIYETTLTGLADGAGEQNLAAAVSTALAASAGKNLLMEVNFSNGGAGWARVDNVTIDAIPEPAVISLIGIFGGGILISRRLFEKKV